MAAYKKQPPSLIGIIALLLITLITAGAIGVTRLDLRSRASFSDNNADVIVVGAGTGGIAAAIQAARMGSRVILLEETDWFDNEVIATKHVDFFDKRSINYNKRAASVTSEDLF